MGVMSDSKLVNRRAATIRGKVASTLILVLLSVGAVGCAESSWVIPYPPGGTASKLWSADPRTRGWNGVVVYYVVYSDHIAAKIRESDGRRGFDARGVGCMRAETAQRPAAVTWGTTRHPSGWCDSTKRRNGIWLGTIIRFMGAH